MSPQFGVSGNLWASTADGNGSISLKATAFQPNDPNATLAASIPLHTDKYLIYPLTLRRAPESTQFIPKVQLQSLQRFVNGSRHGGGEALLAHALLKF